MKHDAARAKMMARRERLLSQMGKIESHLANPLEADSQERALQVENDEVLERLDDAGRIELASISVALDRLEEGTYGICARCRDKIAPARLEAVPHAEYCIDCAGG